MTTQNVKREKMKNHIWGQKEEEDEEVENSNYFIKEPRILETENNRVYFYADIDRGNILQLVRTLKELDSSHVADQINKTLEKPDPIFIHVNSYGGSIYSGLSALDNITHIVSPTITIVDGIVASAATFLTVAGNKKQITRHSTMMIHELRSMFWGKYSEAKDQQKNLDLLMDTIKSIYNEYTKIPSEKLDEILQHDLLFNAKQCLEYGLVDEII